VTFTGGARIGPYEIQALLGAGGMGEVCRALDTRLGRTVAIKVLSPEASAQRKGRLRFEQEARAISSLSHPHICALFDVGETEGASYLVMEYLEGETLASRLLRGALPLDEALRCASEIADALAHAHHHGVVHRDLKPSNVMLTLQGAKLLDFGVARSVMVGTEIGTATETLTVEGGFVGTLAYMAPEQLHGSATDVRTDIFAFGVVLFEMLTGRRPFDGSSRASTIAAILERTAPSLSSVQPTLPPLLDSIVTRCLAKDPTQRWQTASDLRQSLQWIADGASAPVGNSIGRPAAARHRARFLRFGVVAAAAAAVTAGIIAGCCTGAGRRRILAPSASSCRPRRRQASRNPRRSWPYRPTADRWRSSPRRSVGSWLCGFALSIPWPRARSLPRRFNPSGRPTAASSASSRRAYSRSWRSPAGCRSHLPTPVSRPPRGTTRA
jgi:hypothetical protein